jgi:hypothetical protein
MKRLAFAVGVLALGFAASSPARADYAVVKFESGFCRIWWESATTPWGADWQKIAVARDWDGAWAALDNAIKSGWCK